MKILKRKREKSSENFAALFLEITDINQEMNVELKKPETTEKQTNRSNYSTKVIEDYYRSTIYVKVLDNVILDLKTRFSEVTLSLYNLYILIPSLKDDSEDALKESSKNIACKYHTYFNMSENILYRSLLSGLEYWYLHYEKEKVEDMYGAIRLLRYCDSEVFPIIHTLLRILATIPVSNCSAEQTFSSLRRIKSWIRSNMSEDRLVGLALMNIHQDINIDIENIIDRYGASGNYRFNFNKN